MTVVSDARPGLGRFSSFLSTVPEAARYLAVPRVRAGVTGAVDGGRLARTGP